VGVWWAVASGEDWLAFHNDLGVQETFNRFLPIPGSVGYRSEVVVHALAASVFTIRAGSLVVLSGDEPTIHNVLARDPFCRLGDKRIVAFAMEPREASVGEWLHL
jgi:hypothetical protein